MTNRDRISNRRLSDFLSTYMSTSVIVCLAAENTNLNPRANVTENDLYKCLKHNQWETEKLWEINLNSGVNRAIVTYTVLCVGLILNAFKCIFLWAFLTHLEKTGAPVWWQGEFLQHDFLWCANLLPKIHLWLCGQHQKLLVEKRGPPMFHCKLCILCILQCLHQLHRFAS